ncbi:MAG: cell division protein FtsZ [Alphaproteobacteria bacterium]|nr:cell division protein FtsZ [Alphaproteobacteria bacterium]
MTINLTVPQNMQELRPRITVVGVGGAGCNAVNNMINADLEGVDFLVANTDGQALAHSKASRKIQLGSAITQGLGAGSKPEIGRAAAEESLQEVMAELADCNMVFITAGMGGGTGTGAAPVIARAARERGILTVGVITKPFEFEGQRRMKQAESGIEELQAYVDTLIIIPNQNLFRLANERTTFADAFHIADTVLHQGVCGVTDLMIKPGLINLDFADIRAVMGEMGKAMMGTGEASGESRATQAAEAAINNPLLDDTTMKGAHAVLINITGGMDMTLFEVDEAANRIRKEVDADATIIFGSAFDDKLEGVMRVSVVATGIDAATQALGKPSTASAPAAVANLRPSTIVPNPLAGFVPTQPAIAETTMADNSAPADAALSPDVATKADAVDSPDTADAEADVTTADSGTDNTAERRDLSDNADQLDIDDAIAKSAIAKSAIADAPDETGSQRADSSVTTDTDHTAPLAAQTDNDTKSDTATPETAEVAAAPRVGFIPAQTTALPDADAVPVAMETPAKRPASLINKISGLWSTKPDAAEPASRKEPAIGEAQPSASILDLSRSDVVHSDVNDTDKAKLEVSDDELDIPAFLRRQAN